MQKNNCDNPTGDFPVKIDWSGMGLSERKPHCCPVCKGRGFVPHGFYNRLDGWSCGTDASDEQCRSCGGRGIIIS